MDRMDHEWRSGGGVGQLMACIKNRIANSRSPFLSMSARAQSDIATRWKLPLLRGFSRLWPPVASQAAKSRMSPRHRHFPGLEVSHERPYTGQYRTERLENTWKIALGASGSEHCKWDSR